MSYNNTIQTIVKRYFDNAILIDDKLSLQVQPIEVISDTDIELPDDSDDINDGEDLPGDTRMGEEQIAATIDDSQICISTYEHFYKEGFVIFPYRFLHNNERKQIIQLEKVMGNAKLMIVDWNIEDVHDDSSPTQKGEIAEKLINTFVKKQKGLKCIVIYTQEDCTEIKDRLKDKYEFATKDSTFFQEKDSFNGNSLFGFIVSKKDVLPQKIIENISKILGRDKCLTLHFIDMVSKLEVSLRKSINKYNSPFEKAMFAQIFTSETVSDEITSFINDILLSDIIAGEYKSTEQSLLLQSKKNKLRYLLNKRCFTEDKLIELLNIIKLDRKTELCRIARSDNAINALRGVVIRDDINTIEKLSKEVTSIVEANVSGIEQKIIKKVAKELVLILFLWDHFVHDKEKFKESFLYETYRFTKLMKYNYIQSDKVCTGSIYKVKRKNKFLMCITPFCDTHDPSKVNGVFKFIVGELVNSVNLDTVKNEDKVTNSFRMAIPMDKTIKFVEWHYYNTVSMTEEELKQECKGIIILKREYIQRVMNQYIAYQSRAGVDELFYKESNYVRYFVNLFS